MLASAAMYERQLTLDAIRFLASGCFVTTYRCPEIAAAARPGQFVMISATPTPEPLLRRPMAVYGVQREAGEPVAFSLLIEVHGRGTRLMSEARPGEPASVLGPLGRPFPTELAPDAEPLLVMGGVGAAPFPFLAERLIAAGRRPRAFIGGRTRGDLLCVDDFDELGVPAEVATEDGSAGSRGFVTVPLRRYLESSAGSPALIYSCGPTPMMAAVEAIAREHDAVHRVSLEAPMACGIGVCLSCVVPVRDPDGGWSYRRVCREGPVFDGAELLWEAP